MGIASSRVLVAAGYGLVPRRHRLVPPQRNAALPPRHWHTAFIKGCSVSSARCPIGPIVCCVMGEPHSVIIRCRTLMRACVAEHVPTTRIIISGRRSPCIPVLIMTCNHSTPFEIIAYVRNSVPVRVYLQPRFATRHPPVVISRRSKAPAIQITLPHVVVTVTGDAETNNVAVPIWFAHRRGFRSTCRVFPPVEIPICVGTPVTVPLFVYNLSGGIRRRV